MASVKSGTVCLLLVLAAVCLVNASTLANTNNRKMLQQQCTRTYIGDFDDDDGNENLALCGECATRNAGTAL